MGRTMSRNGQIGIGLFVLGVAGSLYVADKLFSSYSGLWYGTTIASLIVAAVGLVLLWKELGRKTK